MNKFSFLKDNKTIIGIGGALLVAISIIAWLMFGGVSPMEVALDNGIKAKFSATLKNTEIKREKEGKVIWHFKVDEVVNDQVTNKTLLHGIKGKVYRDDGSYFDVKASNGEMKKGSQDFIVKDGVEVVFSSDGSKVTTDQVAWEDKQQKITATGHVEVWKDDWYARSDTAVTDSSFKRIRLIGNGYVERRK